MESLRKKSQNPITHKNIKVATGGKKKTERRHDFLISFEQNHIKKSKVFVH
jgi:hypothetical protein